MRVAMVRCVSHALRVDRRAVNGTKRAAVAHANGRVGHVVSRTLHGRDRGTVLGMGMNRLLRGRELTGGYRTEDVALREVRCAAGESDGAVGPSMEIVNKLDIRVGKILNIEEHPEADSLYIEKIDVGEEEPRTIVSGLRPYMDKSDMDGQDVVVLLNLKPRNMRGVKSFGMLLCASAKDDGKVEMLKPPAGTPIGERLCFGTFVEDLPDPATPNQVQKKKVWEAVQVDLKTNGELSAHWKELPMVSSLGVVKATTLSESPIS